MKWRRQKKTDPASPTERMQRATHARVQAEQINQSADRVQKQARPLASKSLAVSADLKHEIQENQWTRKLVESWAKPC